MFGYGFGVGFLLGGFSALWAIQFFERRYPTQRVGRVAVDGRAPFVRKPIEKRKPKVIDEVQEEQKRLEQGD